MFTIGAFSRLGHVSARMLRHYDILGLLRPAHVGEENSYRYYDAAQLSVLRQIETLKEYGFSLAEIGELLLLPQEELAQRIHARRLEAYEELLRLRTRLRRMEDAIIQMEGAGLVMEKYHVIVMEQPEYKVFGLRRVINVSETHQLFEDVHAEMKKRGIPRTGATQMMYLGEEFNYDAMDVEAQVMVSADADGVKTIPVCTCVATTHIGPYESVKYAYDAICAWMAEHPEYTACGPGIERYIKDETMAPAEEMETGVLFPVTRGA